MACCIACWAARSTPEVGLNDEKRLRSFNGRASGRLGKLVPAWAKPQPSIELACGEAVTIELNSLKVELTLDTAGYEAGAAKKVAADKAMSASDATLGDAVQVTEQRLACHIPMQEKSPAFRRGRVLGSARVSVRISPVSAVRSVRSLIVNT